MQSLLEDIAEVRTGLTLRGRDASRRTVEEGLHLLRISDLTATGEICIERPHLIEPTDIAIARHRVRPGDVVVANRGSRMTAALIPSEINAVAGGQLFTIRLTSDAVLPEYLHWFLNRKRTQDFLLSMTRGSYVQTLAISVLRELDILIPPLASQRIIAETSRLAARERELAGQIADLRQSHIEAILAMSLTGRDRR